MRSALAILAVAVLGSACGGQPQLGAGGGGARPEPLASYTGFMYADTPPAAPVQTRFVWYRDPPAERPSSGESASEVTTYVEPPDGSLYRTELWAPPTAGFVQLGAGEVPLTRGSVLALSTDPAPLLLGADVSHWVIYLSADVPERSLTAWWLGRTAGSGSGPAFAAGFHYVAVTPSCLTADALDACATELQSAGIVSDASAAGALCAQPFRLQERPWDEPSRLHLGTTDLACP